MKVIEIRAYKEKIVLTFEGAQEGQNIHIAARVPLVCGPKDERFVEGRVVYEKDCAICGGRAEIDRYAEKIDLLVYRFECGCEGVCYVTEVEEEVSEHTEPYPVLPIKAICSATEEDFEYMGFKQSCVGPNQPYMMVSKGHPDAMPYEHDGKTYYFNRKVIESYDAYLTPLAQKGIACTFRYIHSSFFIGDKADPEILDIIQHPCYDYDSPSTYMSAFNLRTEEGFNHFSACTEFLMERYCRADRKYGWVIAAEVGNEVCSQYIWGNAGEMTCGEYMYEYTEVLRICWLLSRKYWVHFRVHASFDQNFCNSHIPTQPKRYYNTKECMDEILKNCQRDGDFPWNVAFHPYPENLSHPDFWNDRSPNWTFETGKITFKNLEVMPAYLSQEKMLYKGQPRHIILTEQGFNSRTDADYTLDQGKYGYVLAYQKMKKLETISMFVHYNYIDLPGEFGLNLGIRYCLGYDENNQLIPGPRKPICEAIAAMDTDREEAMVAEARAYIGEKIWDYMMNPPEVVAEVDHSRDGLNLPGQGNRKGNKDKTEETVANFDT